MSLIIKNQNSNKIFKSYYQQGDKENEVDKTKLLNNQLLKQYI